MDAKPRKKIIKKIILEKGWFSFSLGVVLGIVVFSIFLFTVHKFLIEKAELEKTEL